ncbi:D-alanyl-D-alanine carboxypeptidase family protein [Oscillatoria sp. FACHB-1407]|nr:D-alanyl-D-alanine carboxypeptidase family protein [Oscillatoria sp. FACHB-1407]
MVGLAIALLLSFLVRTWLTSAPSATVATANESGLQPALIKAGIPLTTPSLLGHLPYEEAPPDTLEAITADGRVRLRRLAAEQFTAMAAAASSEGVVLVPLSGFRSVVDQERVFFEHRQQGERPTERAEVSAPPGYSEHHTGYAIDIVDGTRSETDLEVSFETTPAFRWLEQNAARFDFELSFPQNNPQGLSYEPWHWRFVGDRTSLETFYKARTLFPSPGDAARESN